MLAAAEQPVKYGSKKLAKSMAMVMMVRGPTVDDPRKNRWWLACFGNRNHYCSATGVCVHVEALAQSMQPWHMRRTWWLPFGDIRGVHRRLMGVLGADLEGGSG